MRMLKRLTTVVLGVAFLCAMILTPAKVSYADDAVVWYLTYSSGNWYASSNKMDYWTSPDYIVSNIKDGDHLVVNGDNVSTTTATLKVDKKIGELAATGGAVASIEAPSVNRAYVAGKGSTLIVTANNVNSVEVYPAQTIQIVGNVTNFVAHYDMGSGEHPAFAVTGTVAAANVAYGGNVANSWTTIYGIGAGLLKSNNDGYVTLTADQFSLTPTAAPQTGTTDKAADSSKKQLDKVPQTGLEVSQEAMIFGVLALVFASAAVMVGIASKKND